MSMPATPLPEQPTTTPIVTASDVCRTFGTGEAAVNALCDVSLEFPRGKLTAIMGPSGSGKSTLMNMIGALDVPTAGELRLDGVSVATLDRDQLAGLRNHTIGFVFQQFNLLARTTALDNVKLPLTYAEPRPADPDAIARRCLEQVGLGERMDHVPSRLSGGQQQRVAIARALVNNPSLILADEPTGALDSATSLEILNLFKALNAQGMTIIMVTHELDVASHARRLLRVRDGKLVEDRPVHGLLEESAT